MATEGTFRDAAAHVSDEKNFAPGVTDGAAPRRACALPIPCMDSTLWFFPARQAPYPESDCVSSARRSVNGFDSTRLQAISRNVLMIALHGFLEPQQPLGIGTHLR
jgi:hypothetical protein